MDNYLTSANQGSSIIRIKAKNQQDFLKKSIEWVAQQPINWPLLLDNTVAKELIPTLLMLSLKLRISKRSIYHFFHDLALSYQPLGFIARKITFAFLAPKAISNSYFTCEHINHLIPTRNSAVLYQPVDQERFGVRQSPAPPSSLKSLLEKGSRLVLTPSRITKPYMVNDKNLRAIIYTMACLKAKNEDYHAVIIGEDASEGKFYSQQLITLASKLNVSDRVTILPPAYDIEKYYRHVDLVLSMAPREPFGRIVVEAIACGTPVIGSNTGGIGEILSHFAPHWSIPPDNPDEAAETIINVMASSDTPMHLMEGQLWVQKTCSVVKYATDLKTVVEL